MWEGKWNIKGRTDIGEKLAFSEKLWTGKIDRFIISDITDSHYDSH
jgi:hypothetical protein